MKIMFSQAAQGYTVRNVAKHKVKTDFHLLFLQNLGFKIKTKFSVS